MFVPRYSTKALPEVTTSIENAVIRPTLSCIAQPSDRIGPASIGKENDIVPTEADILCGRPSSNKHPGNLFFRELVISNVGSYMITRKKSVKSQIVSGIINHLDKIGTRFLKWDKKCTRWFVVEPSETRMKVSHALRDRVLEHKNGKEKEPDIKILESPPSASKKAEDSPIILEMTRKDKPDKSLSKAISKKKIMTKSSFRRRLQEISPEMMQKMLSYGDRKVCHRCACGKIPEAVAGIPYATANSVSSVNPCKQMNGAPLMLWNSDATPSHDSLLSPISLEIDRDDIASSFISQQPEQGSESLNTNTECNFLGHTDDLMREALPPCESEDSNSVLPLLEDAWSSLLSFDDFE